MYNSFILKSIAAFEKFFHQYMDGKQWLDPSHLLNAVTRRAQG